MKRSWFVGVVFAVSLVASAQTTPCRIWNGTTANPVPAKCDASGKPICTENGYRLWSSQVYAGFMSKEACEAYDQTPTPTTKIEPVTQPVLHCPDGWHVEVWHKGYDPNAYGEFAPAPFFQKQGYPAAYGPYSPPLAITASDDATDKVHPARCVKDVATRDLVQSTAGSWDTGYNIGPRTVWGTTRLDACDWTGFTYYPKTGLCQLDITFAHKVKCTSMKPYGDKMTCSYKPDAKKELYDLCRKNHGTVAQCRVESGWGK